MSSCLVLRANSFLSRVGAQEVGLQLPLPPSWANSVFCAAGEGGWLAESPVLTRGRAGPKRRSYDKAKRGQESGLSAEFWLHLF